MSQNITEQVLEQTAEQIEQVETASNQPETIQELKDELLGKMKEVEIANSMANYKAQEALNKALDIKSNKKLIAHFKAAFQYQLGITQALGEHSKSSLNIAIGMVDIVSSRDPRLVGEEPQGDSSAETIE